ncbi:DUF4166 domain-containing protein [Aeromicrobium sp. CTD01-1L150]|uniref:DUF4166 domain-containing protein n=1 Tax=Aeromicrobium sp. CTD01-1L150 TaxID=3341830 RepID=UPI0035C19FC6
MSAIFREALGSDFERLHPRLQERFGFSSSDGIGCIGTGRMERIWRGSPLVVPFLHLGARRHLLFPETGSGVPFTIENHAYVDDLGRETLTFVRTFAVGGGRRRRFDATMVHSREHGGIIDYLGTHQHVAAHLDVHVDAEGGLHVASGRMAFLEGLVGLAIPPWACADARVHERWDEEAGCFRITVDVRNRVLGPVFGYHGRFTAHYVDTTAGVPAAIRPQREEIRA